MYRRVSAPEPSFQSVWRYFKHERFVDLLASGELFVVHLPKLFDAFEGALTERARTRLFEFLADLHHDSHLAAESVTEYETHRADFFVNCWHMSDAESYLMWQAYGDRGFAIQTNLARLHAAFDPFPGLIEGRPITYVDFSREVLAIGNVFTAVTTKDVPYRD